LVSQINQRYSEDGHFSVTTVFSSGQVVQYVGHFHLGYAYGYVAPRLPIGNYVSVVYADGSSEYLTCHYLNDNTFEQGAFGDPLRLQYTHIPDRVGAGVYRITEVTTAENDGRQGRITRVSGTRSDGLRWQYSTGEVIDAIRRGASFFVEEPAGDRVEVVVAHSDTGRRYLRTTADGDVPNNLLALPRLPAM
jgi:hypothetical protein